MALGLTRTYVNAINANPALAREAKTQNTLHSAEIHGVCHMYLICKPHKARPSHNSLFQSSDGLLGVTHTPYTHLLVPPQPKPPYLTTNPYAHLLVCPLPAPPPVQRPTPRVVILPGVDSSGPGHPPELIEYQTLALLLEDLNRLLCTPHESMPFHFHGTCTILADPAVGHAACVTIHMLKVHTSPFAAQATTPATRVWCTLRGRRRAGSASTC
ncbi:hypothetical protein C8R44DRAFT_865081 [Mycena epipterygia]|nr:hypothetical protein C8R44DRAFT_865081 [Mycena epipterygia]